MRMNYDRHNRTGVIISKVLELLQVWLSDINITEKKQVVPVFVH